MHEAFSLKYSTFLLAFFLLSLFPSLTSHLRSHSLKSLCPLPAITVFCVFCHTFYCSWQHLHLLNYLHRCSFLSLLLLCFYKSHAVTFLPPVSPGNSQATFDTGSGAPMLTYCGASLLTRLVRLTHIFCSSVPSPCLEPKLLVV